MMGLSFMAVVYIYAKRRNYPVYAKPTRGELLSVTGHAILPILTPGIIVGGIVGGFFTPTEASVVAVLYAMLLGVFIYRRLGLKDLRETMYDSGRFAAISLFCIGTASAFGWLLAYFHIPQLFVDMVSRWGGGITSVGFITAFCFLVIGCFIDAIPAIIIVGTILAPLAANVGMHPIHFAIIGVISIAYGLVTPPYGLCLMIACTVGGIKIKDAIKDTLILFIPMLLVLAFVIMVPDAMLWLPRKLMPTLIK
jgi:tripartite ATP-independent transporter DctM subunit